MSNKEIKVSVIVPVYNQEKLVIKAINSVPIRDDVEIIVIDDHSTDNTYENVKKYAERFPDRKIKLVRNTENRGVGYTVNRGYDMATGEYMVLLGSDDYLYTDVFNEVTEQLDGTDLVYFNLRLNDGYVWQLDDKMKGEYCGSTKFMRREFVGDTRCPEMRAREDYYFYQDLLKKNPTEKFTGKIVKHYNFPREGSLTWIACNGFKEAEDE